MSSTLRHKHHPMVMCHELIRTRTHTHTYGTAHTAETRSLGFAAGPKFQTSTMLEAWTVDAAGKIYSGRGKISGQLGHIGVSKESWTACAVCFPIISFSPSVTSQFVNMGPSGSGNKSRVFWTAKLSTANLSYRCCFVCEAEPLLFDGT